MTTLLLIIWLYPMLFLLKRTICIELTMNFMQKVNQVCWESSIVSNSMTQNFLRVAIWTCLTRLGITQLQVQRNCSAIFKKGMKKQSPSLVWAVSRKRSDTRTWDFRRNCCNILDQALQLFFSLPYFYIDTNT